MERERQVAVRILGGPVPEGDTAAGLVSTAARAVGAAGAVLTLEVGPVRVPLVASDDRAAVAERIAFTVGVGPTTEALSGRASVLSDVRALLAPWTVLLDRWRAEAAYETVLAVPVPLPPLACALTFFFTDVRDASRMLPRAAEVAEALGRQVSRELFAGPDGPLTTARFKVCALLGEVAAPSGLSMPAALDALRVWARRHGRLVDEIDADALVETFETARSA